MYELNKERGVSMEDEVLLLNNVHKTISGREIIKGISFSIKAGEVLGFLGPNGAGKSTTLRMIVGLSKPTQGDIKICGHSIVKDYVKAMNSVGCIIEGPDLYNYMTGWDNLEMLAVMNKNITKQDIMKAVRIVGMEKHLKEKIGTYSLGMKQRIGVAQAIMNKPRLLILDEPTNGLDPSGINEFRNLIHRFAKEENMAILISSHLMSEVEMICDNVSIIKNGIILKNAVVKELLNTQEVFWILDDNKKAMDILSDIWVVSSKIHGEKLVASIDKSIISEINASFIREGLKLQYVDNKHKTLEDLFLNITED
jgi:ABC-2 type transport system ATP-binding protein